jgi:hypothetical protein
MEEYMKRALLIALALAALIALAPVFAQEASGGSSLDRSGSIREVSDLYPVRLDVIRIYGHAQGYKVVYRKGQTSFAELNVPMGWFVAGGKAQLIRAEGPQYPYLVVYYKSDGSFSHLKLYAQRSIRHSSWGEMKGDPGDAFKVDTVKIEY